MKSSLSLLECLKLRMAFRHISQPSRNGIFHAGTVSDIAFIAREEISTLRR